MIIAKDIMTQKPLSLVEDMKVTDAVRTMLNHHISSAPVLTVSGKLLGQISEVFLLKLFILSTQKGQENAILKDHIHELSKITTVQERDRIDLVVKKIISSPFNRVLVLDDQSHLRGIISPKDILRFLVGEQSRSGSLFQEFLILKDRIGILKDQLQNTQTQLSSVSSVIEQSAFLFHSVDLKGKIVLANEKIHGELGYDPGELVGKTILDLFPVDQHKMALDQLKKVAASDDEVKTYTSYLKKTGEVLKVEVISRAIRNEKGEFVATSTLSRVLDSDTLLRTLHGVYEEEE